VRWTLGLVLASLLFPPQARAVRTISMDDAIVVRLELGQPTAIGFPETVMNVVYQHPNPPAPAEAEETPGAPHGRQRGPINSDGPYLFVLPDRPDFGGRIFVVGQSGQIYQVLLKIMAPADDRVYIVPPKPLAKAQPLTAQAVMRALWTHTPLPGSHEEAFPAPTLAQTSLVLVHASALSVGGFIGQILLVTNPGDVPVVLDQRLGERALAGTSSLTPWAWPSQYDVALVATMAEIVAPGGQTQIFLVYKRRP
jgi:hypothetical protein